MDATRRIPGYCKRIRNGVAYAYVHLNGKQRQLGRYGSPQSRKRYVELIAKLTDDGWTKTHRYDDSVTLVEICAAYLPHAERYYTRTRFAIVKTVVTLLLASWGDAPATEFGPLALGQLREQMIRKNWSRKYINDLVSTLKTMLRWAVENEMYPGSRFNDIKALRQLRKDRTDARETDDVEPVPIEDVEATIPHMPTTVAAIVRFQLYTGCRPGEARIIRPCDVEMDGPYGTWVYTPESHKNQHRGHVRQIVIGPKAQNVLRPYLQCPADTYCFTTLVNKRPSTKCYTKDSYCRAVTRSAKRAGVPSWTPNRLRHTAGTDIRARFDYEAANDALGHNSFDVTKIYAKRKLEKAAKVMAEVG